MRTASAEAEVSLAPEAALRPWTDMARWPSFVEGFARVVDLDPELAGRGQRGRSGSRCRPGAGG